MRIHGCEAIPVRVNFEGVMPGTHVVLRLPTDEGIEGISYLSRVNAQNMVGELALTPGPREEITAHLEDLMRRASGR